MGLRPRAVRPAGRDGLRIVHIGRALETGGLEVLILEMCRRMCSRGHRASVCALLPGDGLAERPEYRGVRTVVLDARARRGKLARVLAMARLLRRERPDVVHIHNFLSQVYGAVAARLAGVPVVVTTKHGWDWPSLMGSRAAAGLVWRLADVVVAVSRDLREAFVRAYGYPPGKARWILNGIDTERFRPLEGDRDAARMRVLGVTGRPVLGTVCRLVEEKGIGTLLEAFFGLRKEQPEARLVVVGDGADREKFERQAGRLGIAGRVHFLGMRHDVANIYPLLDLFVLPSYTEGISLTLLEAASCGLPVVATEVGGNPEIVLHGRTGLLVPARDAAALAEAIRQVCADPEAARSMGRAGRERVVREFSLDRMADDYLRLYRETWEAKMPGAGSRTRKKEVIRPRGT